MLDPARLYREEARVDDLERALRDDVLEQFLSHAECDSLLAEVRAYAAAHDVPLIVREHEARTLRYRVIDGDAIHASLPRFVELYARVTEHIRAIDPALEPLANQTASVNVNITPPGGEYRWHYDRNAVTAILFLNRCEGGETEMYPGFRLRVGQKDSLLQRMLDRMLRAFRRFATLVVVTPEPGRMIVMRGDRCLHSVRRVIRGDDRVNVVMTFDPPGARFRAEQGLDPYLYSSAAAKPGDPNYLQP
jgi:hypothetical protein